MFGLESNIRYFLCRHTADAGSGIDALCNIVTSESPFTPTSGDAFLFFDGERHSVHILRWDTDGFIVYIKRLEYGAFECLNIKSGAGFCEITWETFCLIMCGVDLRSVRWRKRYRVRNLGL